MLFVLFSREVFGCSKSFQISHEDSGAIILTIPSASFDETEDSDLEIDDETTATDTVSANHDILIRTDKTLRKSAMICLHLI